MTLPARGIPEEDPRAAGPDAEAVLVEADASVADDHSPAAASSLNAEGPVGAGSAARAGMPGDTGSPAEAGPSVEAAAGDQWSDILAMFVDDPRGSVAAASVMVDEVIEALVATARERQASMAASWQARDADTERLRRTLQDYRALWANVAQMPRPA